jgi:hypothetical protein
MLAWLGSTVALSWVFLTVVPSLPDWVGFTFAILISTFAAYFICRSLPGLRHEELRVRDLILSVEAGRWRSPKAERGADDQLPARAESKGE